ncbi:RNA 2',3'-cyclic phosphodiesterase [Coprothermobacteraceae bacterium]|nr:RNA 2',3'-cyclic phosphodiesterase [Coprothermobacteraceae bacterium]
MRLFFGVRVPPELAAFYADVLLPKMSKEVQGKFVEPENLHVTVLFLGEVPEVYFDEKVTDLLRSISRFETKAQGYGYFGRPPRVAFMNVTDGLDGFRAVHDAVCAGTGINDPKFAPHITLVRFKKPPYNLERLISALPIQEFRWTVDKVTLFESQLTSKGPIYSVVKDYALIG